MATVQWCAKQLQLSRVATTRSCFDVHLRGPRWKGKAEGVPLLRGTKCTVLQHVSLDTRPG
jgi:hypothetical protein